MLSSERFAKKDSPELHQPLLATDTAVITFHEHPLPSTEYVIQPTNPDFKPESKELLADSTDDSSDSEEDQKYEDQFAISQTTGTLDTQIQRIQTARSLIYELSETRRSSGRTFCNISKFLSVAAILTGILGVWLDPNPEREALYITLGLGGVLGLILIACCPGDPEEKPGYARDGEIKRSLNNPKYTSVHSQLTDVASHLIEIEVPVHREISAFEGRLYQLEKEIEARNQKRAAFYSVPLVSKFFNQLGSPAINGARTAISEKIFDYADLGTPYLKFSRR